jgi:hypothetical protein
LIAEGLIIAGSIVLIAFLEFNNQLSSGQLAVFLVAITAVIFIEVLQSRVREVLKAIRYGPKVLGEKSIVNEHLISYIEEESPSSVYLVEYSSTNANRVVESALRAGCSVYLLVRHPDRDIKWNVSRKQSRWIVDAIHGYHDLWKHSDTEFDLNVRFYYRPAGLRARRLDNEYLACGWYTFGNRTDKDADVKRVQGVQNPFVAYPDDNEDYYKLNEMFEKSFYSLWKQGTDLETIHERGDIDYLNEEASLLSDYDKWKAEISNTDADDLFENKPWMEDVQAVDEVVFYPSEEPPVT